MDYQSTIRRLEARGIMPTQAPSLEPMRAALARATFTIDPTKVVIVAGTNGKGSTASAIAYGLSSMGKQTGLYTSPHLIDTRERIALNGKYISEVDFLEGIVRCERWAAGLDLTHFELLTLLAAWYFFEKKKVEYAVLEVGLGGTWDATNSIAHSTTVLTPIDFDHQSLLGTDLVTIARNKFGVIPGSKKAVYAPLAPEVEFLRESHPGVEWIPAELLGDAKLCPLPGQRGLDNWNLALTTLKALGYPATSLDYTSYRWPCRMERIPYREAPCPVYYSGDHNPQGFRSLQPLVESLGGSKLWILLGLAATKDMRSIEEALGSFPDFQLVLTETPFQTRALKEYSSALTQRAAHQEADPLAALHWIFEQAAPSDNILVTGSLYLASVLLPPSRHWLNDLLAQGRALN